MLKFRLFGFPVAIQAFFFLTAYFIGPQHSVQAALLWIPAVFLGVLAHELGHAFAGRSFGLQPVILLHGFGGQTSWAPPHNSPLSSTRKILLTAAGPAVGIFVGVLIIWLRMVYPPLQEGLAGTFASYLIWINLGWGILNLLPVLPLDGGQIVSTSAVSLFGPKGHSIALVISLILTIAFGIWSAFNSQIWMTLLAIILSFSNIRELGQGKQQQVARRLKPLSDAERSYDLARNLAESGKVDEALNWLETAIHAGFDRGDVLDADPNWAALRQNSRFVSLRRRLSRAS